MGGGLRSPIQQRHTTGRRTPPRRLQGSPTAAAARRRQLAQRRRSVERSATYLSAISGSQHAPAAPATHGGAASSLQPRSKQHRQPSDATSGRAPSTPKRRSWWQAALQRARGAACDAPEDQSNQRARPRHVNRPPPQRDLTSTQRTRRDQTARPATTGRALPAARRRPRWQSTRGLRWRCGVRRPQRPPAAASSPPRGAPYPPAGAFWQSTSHLLNDTATKPVGRGEQNGVRGVCSCPGISVVWSGR